MVMALNPSTIISFFNHCKGVKQVIQIGFGEVRDDDVKFAKIITSFWGFLVFHIHMQITGKAKKPESKLTQIQCVAKC